jgi:hypothetical protein
MKPRTTSLEFLLDFCKTNIPSLVKLLSTPVENGIAKRCITRKMIILAEALTFFKNNTNETDPRIQAIKQLKSEITPTKSMLDEINAHRNKLVHHYIADHLLNNEHRFEAAVVSYKANLAKLLLSIDNFHQPLLSLSSASIATSPTSLESTSASENKNSESLSKNINKTPDDNTGLTVLDYAHLILLETTELKNILSNFNTDINDNDSLSNFFSGSDLKNNLSLKEAVLNCVENILTLYRQFNNRYYVEEEKSEKKYDSSVYALEAVINSQKSYLLKFLGQAAELRKSSIHNFEGLLDNDTLKIYIIKIAALKKLCFEKSIECFKASEIHYDPRYGNLLSSPVYTGHSSAEQKAETSSEKSESKSLPFKPRVLSIRSWCQVTSINIC